MHKGFNGGDMILDGIHLLYGRDPFPSCLYTFPPTSYLSCWEDLSRSKTWNLRNLFYTTDHNFYSIFN